MAITTTPLGFQAPDGNELLRNGDNVIAANAQNADTLHANEQARLTQLESAAGFPGTGVNLADTVVNPLLDTATTTRGKLDARYANAASTAATFSAASDPVAYLNNVALLCQFPVRENGEVLWPQGFSINKAADEIYVSNADGPGAILRIDVRTLSTGVRKSSKTITVPAGSWSQGLPWFYNGNSELCFIIRATAGAQANPSTYAIYNYTTSVLGSNVNINGSTNADVSGNFFITSDAWVKNANVFYIYDWASIQAGTPSLLATVPIENAGTTLGKVQGIAIVGSYLYFLHGEQNVNPAITVYSMTGRLVTNRNYSLADFKTAVNTLLPGTLTIDGYIYENESGTNLDGKLVSLQIVNNTAVTAQGVCLILQHNRVDGVPIKATPAPAYVYDTGWQTITLNSGWTASAGVTLQVRRIGSMVRLRGQVVNASATAATYNTIGTLPAGFRPIANSLYFSVSSPTTATMSCRIDPSGIVNLWSSAVTGAVFPLNGITFMLD